jgi:type 2 lantibiotic biosynthesis protein LanM
VGSTIANNAVEFLQARIETDQQFDLLGGAAGSIISLLCFYRYRPSPKTLQAAIQCGDHLLAQAQSMNQGIGWISRGIGTRPLTGFAHGNAGVALALLELSAITGENRFRAAALQAIAYERSLFSPEALNWPDLRGFETAIIRGSRDQVSFKSAWCHGASGIGLARLRCLQYLDDTEIQSEIAVALKTTLAQGFGKNHSLCHGDLGNLELLLQASEILGEPQWRSHVDRLAAIILDSIQQHGWLCGIPLGVESPGLMTGLAGIGYGLLRLAKPTHVPSVLVLAPPTLSGSHLQIPDPHRQLYSSAEAL